MPIDVSGPEDIRPGEIYEDAFYHPCLAIRVEPDQVCGVSLVDGSYPRCADLQLGGVRKLTVEEAWTWRIHGPQDVELEEEYRWWGQWEKAYRERTPSFEQPPIHDGPAVSPLKERWLYEPTDVPVDGDTYVVRVPAGIASKEVLHRELAQRLMFPGYYGANWDALADMLRDLSWTTYRRIVLYHEDLPLTANPAEACVYLSVLRDAVAGWRPGEEHELVVVFPGHTRPQVDMLL